jgi:flagellin-specific chaperone FliS
VTTAKPEKILLMLYEGCLKFIRVAKVKMKEKAVKIIQLNQLNASC